MAQRDEQFRAKNQRPSFVTYGCLMSESRELPRAMIAAEDAKFAEHSGLTGMASRTRSRRTRRVAVAGGSTITQQLAKNLFLPEKSYRKAEEAVARVARSDAHQAADPRAPSERDRWGNGVLAPSCRRTSVFQPRVCRPSRQRGSQQWRLRRACSNAIPNRSTRPAASRRSSHECRRRRCRGSVGSRTATAAPALPVESRAKSSPLQRVCVQAAHADTAEEKSAERPRGAPTCARRSTTSRALRSTGWSRADPRPAGSLGGWSRPSSPKAVFTRRAVALQRKLDRLHPPTSRTSSVRCC